MILLVDDNKDILRTYKSLLELEGYKVSAHSNPETALECFTHKIGQFTTLITDFHMPEMNGLELIQAIHLQQPNIKTILCSGMPPATAPANVTILKKPSSFKHMLNLLTAI